MSQLPASCKSGSGGSGGSGQLARARRVGVGVGVRVGSNKLPTATANRLLERQVTELAEHFIDADQGMVEHFFTGADGCQLTAESAP